MSIVVYYLLKRALCCWQVGFSHIVTNAATIDRLQVQALDIFIPMMLNTGYL